MQEVIYFLIHRLLCEYLSDPYLLIDFQPAISFSLLGLTDMQKASATKGVEQSFVPVPIFF